MVGTCQHHYTYTHITHAVYAMYRQHALEVRSQTRDLQLQNGRIIVLSKKQVSASVGDEVKPL